MTTINPYAPPKSVVMEVEQDGEVWRDGKYLVFRRDTRSLPPRCICCGQPLDAPMKLRTLLWYHSSWNYLLVPLALVGGMLFAAILLLCIRKRLKVQIGICNQHRRALLKKRWLYWGGGALALYGLFALSAADGLDRRLLLVPVISMLIWLVGGVILTRFPLHIDRMDNLIVRAKGCSPDFLKTLPAYERRG